MVNKLKHKQKIKWHCLLPIVMHPRQPRCKVRPMTWWRAMAWPESHTPRVVGCWTGVGFVHYKAELGPRAPQRPKGLHPWEPSEPQPHRENPRIFPESRTLKGASAPSAVKGNVRSEFLPARPNPQIALSYLA